MILVSLATDIADPIERLQTINASSKAAKELTGSFKAAIPTDFPSFGAPWIMSGLALLFGRSKISDSIPPVANVAISNVPGANVPLYMAGAKLATYFPVSIPSHGVALNITVQSYNGSLDYGLTACRRAVPDVEDLAEHLLAAHAEFREQLLVGSRLWTSRDRSRSWQDRPGRDGPSCQVSADPRAKAGRDHRWRNRPSPQAKRKAKAVKAEPPAVAKGRRQESQAASSAAPRS